MINWNKYLALPKWCRLDESGLTVKEMADPLFKVTNTFYVTLNEYNFDQDTEKGGPFITSIIWATSDGSASRSINSKIEDDEVKEAVDPPLELLPEYGAITYREILTHYRHKGIDNSELEQASYRATDGEFVKRIIAAHPFEFSFRKSVDGDGEMPFAISYSLIGK